MSRLADYRHDVYDVTVGSTIGFVVALTIYRRYYPSLFSTRCSDLRNPDLDQSAGAGHAVTVDTASLPVMSPVPGSGISPATQHWRTHGPPGRYPEHDTPVSASQAPLLGGEAV